MNNSLQRTNKYQPTRKSTLAIPHSQNSTNQKVATRNSNKFKNSNPCQTLVSTTSNPNLAFKKQKKKKWQKPCAKTVKCKKKTPWNSISSHPQCHTPTLTLIMTTHLPSNPHSSLHSLCLCSTTDIWTWACSSSTRREMGGWSRACSTSSPWA